jgi:hypothetical protein
VFAACALPFTVAGLFKKVKLFCLLALPSVCVPAMEYYPSKVDEDDFAEDAHHMPIHHHDVLPHNPDDEVGRRSFCDMTP